MRAYSNPERETDDYALPDLEIFQMTPEEEVEADADLMYDARKRFPLASMNGRERDKAIAWAIEESGASGGWYYWYCLPGCLPDSSPFGPYESAQAAKQAAQDEAAE